MELSECHKGRLCTIKSITVEDKIMRRLEALGFVKGTPVRVLNRKRYGAVIIKIRGTRIALGKAIAGGIEVEEVPDER
ncbi:MAG: ferrous iron transport protein A [Butyrivibrio sp.]